jgi:hypothetical protein
MIHQVRFHFLQMLTFQKEHIVEYCHFFILVCHVKVVRKVIRPDYLDSRYSAQVA